MRKMEAVLPSKCANSERAVKNNILVLTKLTAAAALIFAPAGLALGQAAVPDSTSPQPSVVPSLAPSNPSDQEKLPALPSVEQLDAMFKQTPLGKAADEARLHAQWRELRNQTVNEADLVAARASAEAATTDLEKRQRLRAYYTTYFDRMRARAASQELKDFIDARKAEQLGLLAQNRVRPGSSPAANPSPAISPKGKHKKNRAVPEPALPQ
jgi:hypothetical protein